MARPKHQPKARTDSQTLVDLAEQYSEPSAVLTSPAPSPSDLVAIPDDVTQKVVEVNQPQEIAKLNETAKAKVDAVLRTHRQSAEEDVHEYNERVKREFTQQVMESRRQAEAPPPPPQPVPVAIAEQTKREMEAGRKQSAYWAEQQKLRPAPNARDIQAGGRNTPVYQPEHYIHEQGNNSKQHTVYND